MSDRSKERNQRKRNITKEQYKEIVGLRGQLVTLAKLSAGKIDNPLLRKEAELLRDRILLRSDG